jgi:hypothetical protein
MDFYIHCKACGRRWFSNNLAASCLNCGSLSVEGTRTDLVDLVEPDVFDQLAKERPIVDEARRARQGITAKVEGCFACAGLTAEQVVMQELLYGVTTWCRDHFDKLHPKDDDRG